jgi:hypothetical protein
LYIRFLLDDGRSVAVVEDPLKAIGDYREIPLVLDDYAVGNSAFSLSSAKVRPDKAASNAACPDTEVTMPSENVIDRAAT